MRGAGGAPQGPPGRPHVPSAAARPDAERHDALQVPTSFDAAAREHDALQRIARWHGPGEWQAAMLALALEPDAPGAAARWGAWRDATADLTVATAVRSEIEALGPAARRQVFALLAERAHALAPAQRFALQRALLQRWRALPPSPASRLRGLALLRVLHRRTLPVQRWSLAACAAAAHAATQQLALALGADDAAQQAWLQSARAALAEMEMPPPRGPAAGLAPAVTLAWTLALRVRHLAPMQRPLLARAWLLAAQGNGIADQVSVADALHLACLWLDTPVPEVLLAR